MPRKSSRARARAPSHALQLCSFASKTPSRAEFVLDSTVGLAALCVMAGSRVRAAGRRLRANSEGDRRERREQSAGAKVFLAAAAAPRRPAVPPSPVFAAPLLPGGRQNRARAAGQQGGLRGFLPEQGSGLQPKAESRKLLASPGFGRRTGGFTRLSATGGPRRRRSASQRAKEAVF